MFPELEIDEINIVENETTQMGKSFLFDFDKGDFVLVNGGLVEADLKTSIKVWIQKILRTELNRYKIYEGSEYGIQLEDLIGSSLSSAFIDSEIKREVNEKLTLHPKIDYLSEFNIDKSNTTMKISFKVVVISDETLDQEVTMDVRR
jgi:phage baseplate assembly protein W